MSTLDTDGASSCLSGGRSADALVLVQALPVLGVVRWHVDRSEASDPVALRTVAGDDGLIRQLSSATVALQTVACDDYVSVSCFVFAMLCFDACAL